MSLPLLILRPEPGAAVTADRARRMGLDAHAMPLFVIRPLAWQVAPADQFDAVLITSANAIRQGGAGLATYHHLPLLAVGDASAVAARGSGFAHVSAGVEDGPALVRMAVAAGYRRLVHLCGHQHKTLDEAGTAITVICVYSADAINPPPRLPTAGPCVALIHSPRAAARLVEIVRDKAGIHLVTISPAAAQAASGGWASVTPAPLPTDAAMLEIAARICEQGG